MYVCICSAVSSRTVQQLVAEGVRTLEDLADQTDAGAVCGSCVPALEELLVGHAPPGVAAQSREPGPGHVGRESPRDRPGW